MKLLWIGVVLLFVVGVGAVAFVLINPGSATDQDHSGAPGTLALLDINGKLKEVRFVQV